MKKYKIGYTAGSFDLFHIGHLNILRKAKEHCEYLIVGVSTDDLVLTYKNSKTFIPFAERLAIVESIKFVDKVVPQTSLNRVETWENNRFNVMFIGDDWKGSSRWNKYEEQFGKLGVDIIYFHYTKNISSTKLRTSLDAIYESDSKK